MHALECPFKVFLDLRKGPVPGGSPCNEYIIVPRLRQQRREFVHGRVEAAADAVPVHGTAELFCDRKAETRPLRASALGARPGFKHKRGRRKARAPSNSQKFRSFLERLDRHGDASAPENTRLRRAKG